jgi:prevent-host-death family protein
MKRLAASAVRGSFAETLNRVAYQGERVVMHRRGKPIAALVPLEDLAALEALACISHQLSTASADGHASQGRTPSSVLDILSSMPPGASVRAALIHTLLHALATKPGETCRLDNQRDLAAARKALREKGSVPLEKLKGELGL